MSFQVGRIVGLNEPMQWDASNDDAVTVIGSYRSSSVADALQRRDQLLGYPNADEPVIPIVLDGESRATGFYKPVRVQMLTDEFTRLSGNLYDYRLELQRIRGFTQPWCESVINGALLTNAVLAVAGDVNWFHAVPAAAFEYSNSQNPANSPTRSSEDGNIGFFNDFGVTGISSIGRYGIAPASYYVGAARFEQGSSLKPVVGVSLAQADLTNWRLSNGMVRVTPDGTGGLNIAHWTGAAYASAKGYQFAAVIAGTGFPASSLNSLVVLRNSPEECIIRMSVSGGAFGFAAAVTATIDIALRRGDRLVRMYISSSSGLVWRLQRTVAEAAAAIAYSGVTAGGIRANVNDADGNQYVILSYQQATTNDLVNGRITLNANAMAADFAVGSVIAGTAATGNATAINIAKQYLAAQNESQRVVAR